MDLFLIILAALFILVSFAGSMLPVLPGPPLAWLGLLILHFSAYAQFSQSLLIWSAVVMAAVTVLDYLIPIWGTKRFGGSKAGANGAMLGLVAGFFLPPWGFVFGPFAGAFLAEWLFQGQKWTKALKSASGSFVGLIFSTGLKLVYCGWVAWKYASVVFF